MTGTPPSMHLRTDESAPCGHPMTPDVVGSDGHRSGQRLPRLASMRHGRDFYGA